MCLLIRSNPGSLFGSCFWVASVLSWAFFPHPCLFDGTWFSTWVAQPSPLRQPKPKPLLRPLSRETPPRDSAPRDRPLRDILAERPSSASMSEVRSPSHGDASGEVVGPTIGQGSEDRNVMWTLCIQSGALKRLHGGLQMSPINTSTSEVRVTHQIS
jgi:hypothetical protein